MAEELAPVDRLDRLINFLYREHFRDLVREFVSESTLSRLDHLLAHPVAYYWWRLCKPILRRIFGGLLTREVEEKADDLFREFGMDAVPELMRVAFRHEFSGGSGHRPRPGDACAIAPTRPKTAALFFNRVWGWGRNDVPAALRFGNITWLEYYWAEFLGLYLRSLAAPGSLRTFVERTYEWEWRWGRDTYSFLVMNIPHTISFLCEKLLSEFSKRGGEVPFLIYQLSAALGSGRFMSELEAYTRTARPNPSDLLARALALEMRAGEGIAAVPVFDHASPETQLYLPGDKVAVIAAVESVDLIDESRLEWEQVLQFKRDLKATESLKRFMRWLDKDLVGLTVRNVGSEIDQRLSDYREALRRHGIKTVIGTMREAFDIRNIVAGAAIGALSDWVTGLAATGSIAVGKACLRIAEVKLDYETVRGSHPEIHWAHKITPRPWVRLRPQLME